MCITVFHTIQDRKCLRGLTEVKGYMEIYSRLEAMSVFLMNDGFSLKSYKPALCKCMIFINAYIWPTLLPFYYGRLSNIDDIIK